ncbi:hypothetical protein GLOTRDRAFT_126896 [Gloeophyllum trabeum ATCC 11539]|uniref:Prokaryotic-type class I peptide chain release factors domain-containing protein n=1 Tax=Gloeophyllum trabeum (strain ATCC 11539 / FP-39264 / Madison 617) TaxID=670483 RepID=S7RUJ3_GLOTA|nr:uncharacterized protein GLOTRDRAFT_126896 [Gloeophyllum trabeum ATCC 11539]EPQ58405.1 hypothetical protein GLOTRDRAFT_126896 [Gloeophyllum trabeum ATCC 11539]
MSITPSLQAAARSAYRLLWRASAVTFAGDEPILQAFRHKMRTEYVQGRAQTDPKAYEEKIKLASEVAEVLRRNFVQARKVEHNAETDSEVWRVRLTEYSELGDNETMLGKPEPPDHVFSDRKARKCSEASSSTSADSGSSGPSQTLYYSQLKKAHRQRVVPELKEADLEESFVRGSGPGGQSINKTRNNVQLYHKPSGIRLSCQETRSLEQNRKIARKRLLEKLDEYYNPGLSKIDLGKAKQHERERRRRKKAKKKAKEKAMLEGNGDDDD